MFLAHTSVKLRSFLCKVLLKPFCAHHNSKFGSIWQCDLSGKSIHPSHTPSDNMAKVKYLCQQVLCVDLLRSLTWNILIKSHAVCWMLHPMHIPLMCKSASRCTTQMHLTSCICLFYINIFIIFTMFCRCAVKWITLNMQEDYDIFLNTEKPLQMNRTNSFPLNCTYARTNGL